MAQPNQAWEWSRGYFEPLQGMAVALQLAENLQDLLFDLFLQLCSLLEQNCEPPAPTRVPSRLQSLPSVPDQQKNLGLEAGRCERELLFLKKLSWPTGTEDMEGCGG